MSCKIIISIVCGNRVKFQLFFQLVVNLFEHYEASTILIDLTAATIHFKVPYYIMENQKT